MCVMGDRVREMFRLGSYFEGRGIGMSNKIFGRECFRGFIYNGKWGII